MDRLQRAKEVWTDDDVGWDFSDDQPRGGDTCNRRAGWKLQQMMDQLKELAREGGADR